MAATIHLIKLAPGVQDRAMMQAWIDREVARSRQRGQPETVYLTTRNTPKRATELLDGGSIYWIWKAQIQARQEILSIDQGADNAGKAYCILGLAPQLVDVAPAPRRAFQGWRYAEPATLPPDLGADEDEMEGMSDEMRAALAHIGIL